MSQDLFVNDERRVSPRSRRSSLVLASVAIHATAIIAVLLGSILVPGVLPSPHAAALNWPTGPRMVRLADIPLPSHRIVAARPRTGAVPIPTRDALVLTATPPSIPTASDSPADPLVSADGAVYAQLSPGFVNGGGIDPPQPPPQPQMSREPIRLHAGIVAPRKVRNVMPVYPTLARSAGARGVVIIEATIDASGDVVAAKVLRSIPMLDDAALAAVRQWTFTPARLNGEPVAVLMTISINFTLAAP